MCKVEFKSKRNFNNAVGSKLIILHFCCGVAICLIQTTYWVERRPCAIEFVWDLNFILAIQNPSSTLTPFLKWAWSFFCQGQKIKSLIAAENLTYDLKRVRALSKVKKIKFKQSSNFYAYIRSLFLLMGKKSPDPQ